jgi:hypothetical protein
LTQKHACFSAARVRSSARRSGNPRCGRVFSPNDAPARLSREWKKSLKNKADCDSCGGAAQVCARPSARSRAAPMPVSGIQSRCGLSDARICERRSIRAAMRGTNVPVCG